MPRTLKRKAKDVLPPVTERQLQKCIMDAARECGWLVHHQSVALYSAAGLPDLCLVKGTRLIMAELKSAKGTLTPQQQVWLDALKGVPGIEVYLWKPADLDTVYRILLGDLAGGLAEPAQGTTDGLITYKTSKYPVRG